MGEDQCSAARCAAVLPSPGGGPRRNCLQAAAACMVAGTQEFTWALPGSSQGRPTIQCSGLVGHRRRDCHWQQCLATHRPEKVYSSGLPYRALFFGRATSRALSKKSALSAHALGYPRVAHYFFRSRMNLQGDLFK